MKMDTNRTLLQPMNVISNRNFDAKILAADRPVLLMCVPSGQVYAEQVRVLQQLSDPYRSMVDVCCLEEDFMNGFRQMYGIKGTPVFLLFHGGKETGRILGMADKERLEAFLTRHLPVTSIQLG